MENLTVLPFNLITCYECSEEVNETLIIEHESESYCEACYNEKFDTCTDCQETLKKDELSEINGNTVCENCMDNNYSYCDECENYFDNSETRRAQNRRGNEVTICQDCYTTNYTKCEDCGDVHHDYNINNGYCGDCYSEHYFYCNGCWQDIDLDLDDVTYDEDSGNSYCNSCARERKNDGPIKNHDYKPKAEFFKISNERVFLGLELEVDNGQNCSDTAEAIQHPALYFKEDGSLNDGFEIVTHPLSYEWIIGNKKMFEDTFKTLTDNGFRSYKTETCGMHIHISKSEFNTWHLYRFMKFFKENKSFILKISQRKQANLERWANIDDEEFTEAKMRKKAKDKTTNCKRYLAINLNNSKTIEIRIFRGTLKAESFFKNIEFVYSLYEYTREAATESVTFKNYLAYVAAHPGYKNLITFLKTNNICA